MYLSSYRNHSIAAVIACTLVLMAGRVHGSSLVPVGSRAPGFTLPSQENQPVSLSDYKGKWVVFYFYPKDQTTGCTLEAHNFQRDLDQYQALHAVVLGVSLDTVDSHKTFCTKDSLTFKLLADPNQLAISAYGVPIQTAGNMHFAARTTFLISPGGKIVREWQVSDIAGHSAAILSALRSLAML